MIIKFKALAFGERMATATASADGASYDCWINMDQVTVASPDTRLVNRISVGQHLILRADWEQAVKAYHDVKYKFVEAKQSEREILAENDRLYMNKNRLDVKAVCSLDGRGLVDANRSAIAWMNANGYTADFEEVTWTEMGLPQCYKFKDANDLLAFATEKGWTIPVTVLDEQELADDLKGYQFTAIVEDDGRTLQSFPRGLAGQEVRVTVLGIPWAK